MSSRPEVGATRGAGIGTRIRAARKRLGWNREALAFHSGISWSAIAQVERGRRVNLRPSTLSALAHALGVSIDHLVDGTLPPPMLEHRALLYESEEEFLGVAAPFLAEAAELAEGAIAVTSPARIRLLRDALRGNARHVEFADHSRWYGTPLSASEGYRLFLDRHLDNGAPWIRVVGEPLWTGRSPSQIQLWTRYESLMNLVFSAAPASLLCPYDVRELDEEIIEGARVTHPHAVEHAALMASPKYVDPSTLALGG
jgi:transcriptional regulator with XRE-family HTH domain